MNPGVLHAVCSALLFGMGMPLSKLLLVSVSPLMLAALLYLGSGLGLALVRCVRREPSVLPKGTQWFWLGGAVLAGGVMGPLLLMLGLSRFPAAGASLLLNAEGVFTALLAWWVFKENFDRRIAWGMGAIVAGGLVLSWPLEAGPSASLSAGSLTGAALIVAACIAWAVDNNLTRKVSLADAGFIAMVKGLVAGSVNLMVALVMSAALPGIQTMLLAGLLGFASYGASLVLFVLALRHLGTARTGAYFSVAPFAGAALSVWLLNDPVTWPLLAGGALMLVGVVLHMTEHHQHAHRHEEISPHEGHSHMHRHGDDPHHQHAHNPPVPKGTLHSHAHGHAALSHFHAHFPDAHHQHEH